MLFQPSNADRALVVHCTVPAMKARNVQDATTAGLLQLETELIRLVELPLWQARVLLARHDEGRNDKAATGVSSYAGVAKPNSITSKTLF